MSNSYYVHGTFPTPNSPGSSAQLRNELELITDGFDKLPTLTGNGNKVAVVNSSGTALTASASLQNLAVTSSTINSTPIGASSPSTGAFTTASASSGFTGNLVGNVTGTVTGSVNGNATTVTNGVYTTDTGTVTNTMLAGSIADSKLQTISTAGKVSNSATTATDADTPSAIVSRDASGNFSAGTITASLTGAASEVEISETASASLHYVPFVSYFTDGNYDLRTNSGIFYQPSTKSLTIQSGSITTDDIVADTISFGNGSAGTQVLRFGTSNDAYLYYNGSGNEFVTVLNTNAISLVIRDGVTDRFTFTKSTGDLTATSFTGDLTGDVTGSLTGSVTGNVIGDLTGNVTGAASKATVTSTSGSTASHYLTFVSSSATGDHELKSDPKIYFQPSTNALTVLSGSITTDDIYPDTIVFSDGSAAGSVLKFGDSSDASLYYSGGSTNELTVELDTDATALVIKDGVTDRFTFTKSTGDLTATSFTGDLTGDVTGNLTGSVTGNVTGDLTGNVTGNVTGAVTGNVTGNLTGNVTAGSGTSTFNDVTVNGDLTVSGTTTTINTETIALADNQIILNSNYTGSTPTENGGIEIERGTLANKTLVWDETADKWTVGSETFIAGTFEGNLTGDITGNVTGNVTGNLTGNVTGDVTGSASQVGVTNTTTNAFFYIPFISNYATANYGLGADASIYYNPSTNTLTATSITASTFTGSFSGNGTSAFLSLTDSAQIRLGAAQDAKFFYDGSFNRLNLELETAATSFIITDNGTTKFTFTKSNGDLAATSFTGDLTGDVTGNVTGDVTGDLTGNVIGNVTGNVTGNLNGDVTGDITGGGTLTDATFTNYTESAVSIGTVTSAHTFSLTNGTVQTCTLTASTACTFTMPTAVAGKSFLVFVNQAATTGNGTATFTGALWAGGTAPTITATAGSVDMISFISDGTNWYGNATQDFS